MSLFNLNIHNNAESSEARVVFGRSVAVSEIGSRQSDELKKNTLQDDVVTFSSENSSSQNRELFSKNRFQALAAYKNFSRTSIQDAAKEVMASQSTSSNNSENIEDPRALLKSNTVGTEDDKVKDTTKADEDHEKKSSASDETKPNGDELTEEEKDKLQKLKKRDAEVVTHEKAHQAAGGQYASAPSYEYEKGPDGKNYAVGGHVNIDVSEESDPDKTIQKMRIVIKAAKAPAQPSGQDMKVAAEAQQKITQAQMEKAKSAQEEQNNKEDNDSNSQDKDMNAKPSASDTKTNETNNAIHDNDEKNKEGKSNGDVSTNVSKLSDITSSHAAISAAVSQKMDIA